MPNINKILRANPVPCRYGAPMGSRSYIDPGCPPLYVQRIRFVDGDYSADGTYWGGYGAPPLYCGFDPDGMARVWVRALNRADAIKSISNLYPQATFRRN